MRIMVAGISPLNWDFLGCSELMIKVFLARIPFIGAIPGCMALVSVMNPIQKIEDRFYYYLSDS